MGRKSESKRAFKLYNDYKIHVDLLSDEDAGKLFKAILNFANGIKSAKELDGATMMAFSFISAQMARDAEAYDKRCEVNRANGKKGGRPRKHPVAVEDEPTEHTDLPEAFEQEAKVECVEEPEKAKEEPVQPKTENRPKRQASNEYTPEFESFWKEYPRKVDKGAAWKAWKARIKEGESPQNMRFAAIQYAIDCRRLHREPEYIKHAKTFLGETRAYKDYLTPLSAGGQGFDGVAKDSADEKIRNGINPFA